MNTNIKSLSAGLSGVYGYNISNTYRFAVKLVYVWGGFHDIKI